MKDGRRGIGGAVGGVLVGPEQFPVRGANTEPGALAEPDDRPDVADVGGAALDCLERMGTIGKTYMIGGRDEVTFDEFMRRLAVAAGVKRPRVHIPILLAMGIARTLAAVMKNPPLTVDNVLGVMQARRVDIAPAVEDFQFGPMGLEEGLKLTFAPK